METKLKIIKVNEDEKTPEEVYKYRDFGNEFHRNMILKNEFFFASPVLFNDPFDHDFQPIFSDEYARKHTIGCLTSGLTDTDRERYIKHINDPENIANIRVEVDKKHRKVIRDMYRVFCSSTIKDSISQWSYYANAHKGYCVEIDIGALVAQCISSWGGYDGFLAYGPVMCEDVFPSIHFDKVNDRRNEFFAPFFRKAKTWENEEEYRFVYRRVSEKPTPSYFMVNDQFDENSIITAVYFGCRYKENDDYENTVQPIIDACRRRNIPIYVAYPNDRAYKLDFRPLED